MQRSDRRRSAEGHVQPTVVWRAAGSRPRHRHRGCCWGNPFPGFGPSSGLYGGSAVVRRGEMESSLCAAARLHSCDCMYSSISFCRVRRRRRRRVVLPKSRKMHRTQTKWRSDLIWFWVWYFQRKNDWMLINFKRIGNKNRIHSNTVFGNYFLINAYILFFGCRILISFERFAVTGN